MILASYRTPQNTYTELHYYNDDGHYFVESISFGHCIETLVDTATARSHYQYAVEHHGGVFEDFPEEG